MQACILLHYTLLHFRDTMFFKNRKLATSPIASQSVPFSNGICSLPVCQSFGNSHKISNFFIIICHSDLWCYYCNWGEYKMVHLMCVFCLLHRLAIHPSLFLSWSLSILWDTTILKLGQLITLQWLPHVPVKGRITQSSKLECCLILINCHSHPNL